MNYNCTCEEGDRIEGRCYCHPSVQEFNRESLEWDNNTERYEQEEILEYLFLGE